MKADAKDAMLCNELIFKRYPATDPGNYIEDEPGSSGATPPAKKQCMAPEGVPGEGVPGNGSRADQAHGKARLHEEPQMTKRVVLPGDASRSFTISANLPAA